MKFKRSMYNIIVGIIGQSVTIILGIVIPRLFITNFGSEVNGLMSSVNQIYIYIGLLEAGIGTATIQALYRPIAHDNKTEINSILAATNKYYKKTGFFYLLAVLAFAGIYPQLINTTIDKGVIFLVILLSGLGSVINFFYQGKYKMLLQAEGRSYIITSIATLITIFTSSAKIILILLGYNIITIQLAYLFINILQMAIFGWYIKTNFSWIDLKVKPNFEAIAQKNFVLVHQISTLIFSNTDILVLTFFTNLKVVSVYALYNLIYVMVYNLLGALNSGLVFNLGQSYQRDFKVFSKLLDAYETYYMAINFALYGIAYLLILPFFGLYTRGVSDINYIDKLISQLFLAIQVLVAGRVAMSNTINIAGKFKETYRRSILESIINLVISIVLVMRIGIYGVLIGTIVALFYRTNDMIIYCNRQILFRSVWTSYRKWLINIGLLGLIIAYNEFFPIRIANYGEFILMGLALLVIIVPGFLLVNSLVERESYRNFSGFLRRQFNKSVAVKE